MRDRQSKAARQALRSRLRPKAVGLGLFLLAGLLALATVLDFARRMDSSAPDGGDLPRDAAVFTGQFDRIHAGLALLREGRVERLFISGVNPGAGIHIARFADQFGLNAGLRQALEAGRIALGPDAQSTRENAAETACWARTRGVSGAVLLITSRSHMPRASLALERALPGRDVHRLSLSGEGGGRRLEILGTEILKFAATALTGLAAGATTRIACLLPREGEAGTRPSATEPS